MGRLTGSLIIINVIVFLMAFSMPEEMMKEAFGIFSFSAPLMFQLWRWVTSAFFHVSASHLFFNMLGLYFFGKVLEDEVKPGTFLGIYFLSEIMGNLLYAFTSNAPVVGASGAVFGLMGAAMLLKPKERIKFYLFPLPLGLIAIVYAVVESLLVVTGNFAGSVAHIAHVGGLITGSLLAFRHNAKQAGKGLLWLALFLIIIIILGPVFSLIFGIGEMILGVLDFLIGGILYTLAGLLGFLW